jgi:hypothetical protein
VLNVSDGAASDGDPEQAARALTSTGTDHGSTLLFNLQLTSKEIEPVRYPVTPAKLPSELARRMFAISSVLPSYMIEMAEALGAGAQAGSRGFVLNGDMVSLVQFLTIGTSPAIST